MTESEENIIFSATITISKETGAGSKKVEFCMKKGRGRRLIIEFDCEEEE